MEPQPHTILHYKEGFGKDSYLSGEGPLSVINYLRDQGVEPVVVRGNEGWDLNSGLIVPSRIIVSDEDGVAHVRTQLFDRAIEIGATSIRDYSSVPVGPRVENEGGIVINPESIRGIDDKDLAYEVLGDLQPLTVVVEPDKLIDQLGDMRTQEVVLKPVRSADSGGLLIVTKSDLLDSDKFKLERMPDGVHLLGETDPPIDLYLDRDKGYLLQEAIDTKAPFPTDIHVIESCKPDYLANLRNPKEVRLMLYWDDTRPDKQIIVPYARTFTPISSSEVRDRTTHIDNWLLLDIEHGLPEDLEGIYRSVVGKLLRIGNTKYLHGAIDVAFDGNRWYVMELNLWFPLPPSYKMARDKGAEGLADIHRHSMADLMADTAKDAAKAHEQKRRINLDT